VLTREGCHLCDEVLVVVRRVCAELGVGLAEIDVDADADLRTEYTDHVPVTFVDGRRFDFWRIDEGRLRTVLTS
jgi:glutaredoxin